MYDWAVAARYILNNWRLESIANGTDEQWVAEEYIKQEDIIFQTEINYKDQFAYITNCNLQEAHQNFFDVIYKYNQGVAKIGHSERVHGGMVPVALALYRNSRFSPPPCVGTSSSGTAGDGRPGNQPSTIVKILNKTGYEVNSQKKCYNSEWSGGATSFSSEGYYPLPVICYQGGDIQVKIVASRLSGCPSQEQIFTLENNHTYEFKETSCGIQMFVYTTPTPSGPAPADIVGDITEDSDDQAYEIYLMWKDGMNDGRSELKPKVLDLQIRLKKLGYSIVLNGEYGDETSVAVAKFQRDNRHLVDGYGVSEKDWDTLQQKTN